MGDDLQWKTKGDEIWPFTEDDIWSVMEDVFWENEAINTSLTLNNKFLFSFVNRDITIGDCSLNVH